MSNIWLSSSAAVNFCEMSSIKTRTKIILSLLWQRAELSRAELRWLISCGPRERREEVCAADTFAVGTIAQLAPTIGQRHQLGCMIPHLGRGRLESVVERVDNGRLLSVVGGASVRNALPSSSSSANGTSSATNQQ